MEPYPSGQFGFIDDPDRQSDSGSVLTGTRTRSDGPDPLLIPLGGRDRVSLEMHLEAEIE
jgi:hypothetical protein